MLHVNDLDEYRIFTDKIQHAQRVLIMGAGLVGCEFANDLHSQGIASILVDPAPFPLAALLPAPLGNALQKALTDIGVEQFYGCTVSQLTATDSGYEAQLSNGESLDADLVLSAAGLSVDTTLAASANIQCERGIVVNAQLATNQANIYALGDCAEINGQLRPYIAPILPSVKALAQTLLGNPTDVVFGAMPVSVKTPCCPVVACPPANTNGGEWRIEGEQDNLIARFEQAGKTTGFACTGYATSRAKTLQQEMA